MGIETELKLTIDPTLIKVFQQQPLIQSIADTKKIIQMRGIYYDTPDQQLRQSQTSLRVRLENQQWVQTIKSAGSCIAGLHQRNEWEFPVANQDIVYSQLPTSLKKTLFSKPNLWASLIALFETQFERYTWQFIDQLGNHIEICLDQGQIKTAIDSEIISEVELELKQGDINCLTETAAILQQNLALCLENSSKAARGYQLYKKRLSIGI